MEPTDDPQLRKLLREWRVEDAPASLDRRVLGVREPWWRFLIAGSLRVPVPVAVLCVAALLAMGAALAPKRKAPPPPAASAISLADFQPVQGAQARIIRSRE